jgi:hypothetical protein
MLGQEYSQFCRNNQQERENRLRGREGGTTGHVKPFFPIPLVATKTSRSEYMANLGKMFGL